MNKDIEALLELAWNCADEYYHEHQNLGEKLAFYRKRLSTVGCWIPCDANNPPPVDVPMLLWCPEKVSWGVRQPASPVWADETCYNVGEPGEDYTHYMLIEEPSS